METDDGGWALVTVAGTITTSKRETAQQDEFFPLLDVWGEYDAGSFTSLRSFSRLDLFYGLLRDDGEFMATRQRRTWNLMIWPVGNASRWRNMRTEDNIRRAANYQQRWWPKLPEIDYMRLSIDYGNTFQRRQVGVSVTGSEYPEGHVGYYLNPENLDERPSCNSGGFNAGKYMGPGQLLLWEVFEHSKWTTQWFQCHALGFEPHADSFDGYYDDQDVLFWYRTSSP
eukprot:TRINITY_DN2296_c0_g1_i1.p1 TRINITY_DN2296_c0_g1~~TRINITY_DN2296_c0_g1_i1.p1  ORF type:complete len:227 (+),score=35.42 TRINITY_DN2296_c0_g1_i1:803-1483(+)